MDLTPRLLTEVEFAEQWRGYSKNEVDDFLERVAAALGELQARLHEAGERATRAERQLLDRGDEEEIRRTLVLAQRAAASAVQEAQAEAARLREEAHQRASDELGALEQRKAALEAELEALAVRVDEQRAAIRAELEGYLAELAEPFVPPAPAESPQDIEPDAEPETPAEPETAPENLAEPAPAVFDDEVAHAREELVEALRRAGVEPVPEEPSQDDGDEFLAELRRAVNDDAPLGPRDDD